LLYNELKMKVLIIKNKNELWHQIILLRNKFSLEIPYLTEITSGHFIICHDAFEYTVSHIGVSNIGVTIINYILVLTVIYIGYYRNHADFFLNLNPIIFKFK